MPADFQKQAVKSYQKTGGNFQINCPLPLKSEKDLAVAYYPGIIGVLNKIQRKEKWQPKFCSHHRTVAIISTRPPSYYPLLTARAALISQICGINVIPLMIRYRKVKELPRLLEQLSPSYQAIIATDLLPEEKIVLSSKKVQTPVLFEDELLTGAAVAGALSATRLLKSTVKKIQVACEGISPRTESLLSLLNACGFSNISVLDERGAIYKKRPNMNRHKNELCKAYKLKKDTRTSDEILNEADIYISDEHGVLKAKKCKQLKEKSVIIALVADAIENGPQQSVISTLPQRENHISDLHLAVGILYQLHDELLPTDKSLLKAIKALSNFYKKPQKKKLIPGLLEKNLAKNIAKAL